LLNGKKLNNGYVTGQFYSITLNDEHSDDFLMGGLQDNGTYLTYNNDVKDDWFQRWGGDGSYSAVGDSFNYFFVSWQASTADTKSSIFMIGDNDPDDNLLDVAGVSPKGAKNTLFINPFILDPNDRKIMYLPAGLSMWRNSNTSEIPLDNEINRTSINWTNLVLSPKTTGTISSLAASKVPANILYYGTKKGEVMRIDDVNSENYSATDIWKGKGLPDGTIQSIFVDPLDADKVIISFSNYEIPSLFYTTDGGETWTDVSGNLEVNIDGSGSGPSVRAVALLIQDSITTYFAGTSTGLYSTSTLNGNDTVWEKEGPNTIGNSVVSMIVPRQLDKEVVVATHGNGIFSRADIVTAIDDVVSPPIPDSPALHQNYPNPFNPETTISFELRKTDNVTLEIYNILGQKVRTLISNKLNTAGAHKIKFDGTNDFGMKIASGMYFYRLTTNGVTINKKMLLIK